MFSSPPKCPSTTAGVCPFWPLWFFFSCRPTGTGSLRKREDERQRKCVCGGDVRVCVCRYICTSTRVKIHVEARVTGCHNSLWSLRQTLSVNLNPGVPAPPELRLHMHTRCARVPLFWFWFIPRGFWGLELGSSCLHLMPFTKTELSCWPLWLFLTIAFPVVSVPSPSIRSNPEAPGCSLRKR